MSRFLEYFKSKVIEGGIENINMFSVAELQGENAINGYEKAEKIEFINKYADLSLNGNATSSLIRDEFNRKEKTLSLIKDSIIKFDFFANFFAYFIIPIGWIFVFMITHGSWYAPHRFRGTP